jgi:hypothetical protein
VAAVGRLGNSDWSGQRTQGSVNRIVLFHFFDAASIGVRRRFGSHVQSFRDPSQVSLSFNHFHRLIWDPRQRAPTKWNAKNHRTPLSSSYHGNMNDASAASGPQQENVQQALERFDQENSLDPNTELENGRSVPREWLYAQRLTHWVLVLSPNPSRELLLASRCQHLCRWQIPRSTYPQTKAGYLRWRNDLKQFHARQAGEILRETGHSEETIARVQALNLKINFPDDPETRVLEDALCLLFLQHQLAPLAQKTSREKVVNALRKSWAKMTPAAREHALKLPFGPRESQLISEALNEATADSL